MNRNRKRKVVKADGTISYSYVRSSSSLGATAAVKARHKRVEKLLGPSLKTSTGKPVRKPLRKNVTRVMHKNFFHLLRE